MSILTARTQQKTDIKQNWDKAVNFIPLKGEIIVYSDLHQIKVGDGVTKLADLEFLTAESTLAVIKENPELHSIVFNKGEANAKYSIAGGSNDKSLLTDIIGDVAGILAPTPDVAKANGIASISYGAGTISHAAGTLSMGVNSHAGCLGYYIWSVNSSTNTLELSLNQKPILFGSRQVPTKLDWKAGDVLSIVNGEAYPLSCKITSVDTTNKTVTVDALPFTSLDTSSRNVNDMSVCVVSKPESGEVALGFGSFAYGYDCKATGLLSTAFGYQNTAIDTTSFVTGRENTSAFAGFVGGYQNKVTGGAGFSAGSGNTVTGSRSSAIGGDNVVSGDYSHIAGLSNELSGNTSAAFGHNNKSGKLSTLIANQDNEARANISTVFGYHNKTAEQQNGGAQGFCQTVVGRYNDYDSIDSALFVVGNGDDENSRSNALTVNRNGSTSLNGDVNIKGNSTHAGKVTVKGKIDNTTNNSETLLEAGTVAVKTVKVDNGDGTYAPSYALQVGSQAQTNGSHSLAVGAYATTSGNNSAALGYGAQTNTLSQTAVGRFNDYESFSGDTKENTALFMVGNGDGEESRSNALVVTRDGSTSIQNDLTVGHKATIEVLDVVDTLSSSHGGFTTVTAARTDTNDLEAINAHVNGLNVELGATLNGGLTSEGTTHLKSTLRTDGISTFNNKVNVKGKIDNTTSDSEVILQAGSVSINTVKLAKDDGTYSAAYALKVSPVGEANGAHSLSVGAYAATNADNTAALGYGSHANIVSQTVVGRYNDYETLAADTGKEQAIFVVGNGDGDTTRSNALVVRRNGNTEITGRLQVNGELSFESLSPEAKALVQQAPLRINFWIDITPPGENDDEPIYEVHIDTDFWTLYDALWAGKSVIMHQDGEETNFTCNYYCTGGVFIIEFPSSSRYPGYISWMAGSSPEYHPISSNTNMHHQRVINVEDGIEDTDAATVGQINKAIAGMVDSAPETLNTLNELAAALGDDANFAATVATQIGNLESKVGDTSVEEQIKAAVKNTLVVTMSYDNVSDSDKSSHTPAEIYEHTQNGGTVVMRGGDDTCAIYIPLTHIDESSATFCVAAEDPAIFIYYVLEDGTVETDEKMLAYNVSIVRIFEDDDGNLTASHSLEQIRDSMETSGGAMLETTDGKLLPFSSVSPYYATANYYEDENYLYSYLISEDGRVQYAEIIVATQDYVNEEIANVTITGSNADFSKGLDMKEGYIDNIEGISFTGSDGIEMNGGFIDTVRRIQFVNSQGLTARIRLEQGNLRLLSVDDAPVKLNGVADGTDDTDAVNVGQLNAAIGDIESALDSIIAIQNGLIGGNA